MTDEDQLLAHEIECHQFTEPLKPPARPPNLARRLIARASGKVWFRVGWTCECVVRVLETAEQEMLLRGLIKDSLDIFQLQGNASASAGTHSKPGAYDIDQDSPEQIDVQRLCGGDGQARTTAQGFAVKHCHGFAQGCPHGSAGLLAQKRLWNRRLDGLVSNGPVLGRWPTKKWSTAIKERAKIIMGLKEDIVREAVREAVAAAVKQLSPKIPPEPKPVRKVTNKPQTVPADLKGWTTIKLDDAGNTSAVIGQNDEVDVTGTIEVKTGPQPSLVRLWWALVDVRDGTPPRYVHFRSQSALVPAGTPVFGLEKTFKGPVPKPSAAGRSWRLRLLMRASQPVEVTAVEVTGTEMP